MLADAEKAEDKKMKRDDRSPQHYIDSVDSPQRELLLSIRDVIQKVDPSAKEYIEYGMLAYGDLANLAAQMHYVSLYVPPTILVKHKKRFPGVDCGKSCLRFKSQSDFNTDAVRELLGAVAAANEK